MKMTYEELNVVLEKHKLWLDGDPGGKRANLAFKDLSGATLSGANLKMANFYGANLSRANLIRTNLFGANLSRANLSRVNLSRANLSVASLFRANLSYANLCGAKFYKSDLRKAVLDDVITDEGTSFFHLRCPRKSQFIAWKKAISGNKLVIIKLLVPEDALRSSATTRKCRVSKATVLEIQNLDGTPAQVQEARSNYDYDFIYRTGETVEVKDFDTDRWNECAPGIHCFVACQEAVDYNL